MRHCRRSSRIPRATRLPLATSSNYDAQITGSKRRTLKIKPPPGALYISDSVICCRLTMSIQPPATAPTETWQASTMSNTVTGSATSFTTQLAVGQTLIYPLGYVIGTIQTINSDTQITLTANSLVDVAASISRLTKSRPALAGRGFCVLSDIDQFAVRHPPNGMAHSLNI